jgi:hypothetical protein
VPEFQQESSGLRVEIAKSRYVDIIACTLWGSVGNNIKIVANTPPLSTGLSFGAMQKYWHEIETTLKKNYGKHN